MFRPKTPEELLAEANKPVAPKTGAANLTPEEIALIDSDKD